MSYKRFDGALYSDADGQLLTPNRSGERVYLTFRCLTPGPRRCAVTGKDFELRERVGFFIDGEETRPVAPSTALTKGFTMTQKDFRALEEKLELLDVLKGADLCNKRAIRTKKETK